MDWELSMLVLLSPVAVGAPGKRSFFLVIGEKALDTAVRQLLRKSSFDASKSSLQEEEPSHETSRLPAAELQLREANLSFQDGQGMLALTVDIIGPREEGQCSLRFYPTLAQLRQFTARAEEVCAAGRPICPVCGQPMDPSGHDCPGNN